MRVATFESTAWPDGIIQLLDDHHLVVLSDSSAARRQFAGTLKSHLEDLPDTQVIAIDGTAATDLHSFCRQLEKRLAAPHAPHDQHHHRHGASPWWRDVQSVIKVLRDSGRTEGGGEAPKRRYFLWHEAHVMLEADVELFAHLVNALFAVAAEFEHTNLEPLLLQRVVFIGGAKLGAYAEDVNGQFCKWLEDEEGSPFWEVASVMDRPPVLTYRIDG